MNMNFSKGKLKNLSFGDIYLLGMKELYGDFAKSVEQTKNVLNIRENVEFPLLLMKKFSKNEIDEKVEKVIKEVGLENFINHRPSELSGGQRQRVAIARALVTEPEIILADEPTANLDSKTSEQILELMKELNVNNKTTFIFSTHDPDVLKYANRIVKIKDGLLEE